MKKEILIPSLMLAFASSTIAAVTDWTVLDEMETAGFPSWTLTQSEGGFGSLKAGTLSHGGNTGEVLYIASEGQGTSWGHTSAVLPLTTPIAEGETGTVYLKYWEEDNGREYIFGLSDVAQTDTLPNDWPHYEVTVQRSPFSSRINLRDAGSYRPTTADGTANLFETANGTWYEFWMVVHNNTGALNDEFSLYIKGGAFTTPTLLQVAVNSGTSADPIYETFYDTALFRNGTTGPILNVFIRTISGDPENPNDGDDVYIDRVAQAPGIELTTPPMVSGTTWAGYSVDANGDCDTGAWLGWVNVNHKPWIWSYSLSSWMYIVEGQVTASGSWAYIKK